MDEAYEQQARSEARTLSTIWLALVFSVAVYVLLGAAMATDQEPAALQRAVVRFGSLEVALALVRTGVMALGVALLAGAAVVARGYLAEGAVLARSRGADEQERLVSGFGHLRRFSILAWILAQTVILIGALWAMLSGRVFELLPFAVAGGTALLMLKPEEAALVDLARTIRSRRGAA